MVRSAPGFEMRARRAVDARRDRQAERLARDVGGEREQLLGLVTQGSAPMRPVRHWLMRPSRLSSLAFASIRDKRAATPRML